LAKGTCNDAVVVILAAGARAMHGSFVAFGWRLTSLRMTWLKGNGFGMDLSPLRSWLLTLAHRTRDGEAPPFLLTTND
jgi:hypothetical protein